MSTVTPTADRIADRKALPPATGAVRWLPPEAPYNAPRLRVECNGTVRVYTVLKAKRADTGYYLAYRDRHGEVVVYTVDTSWADPRKPIADQTWLCDCPDALNRPDRLCHCKHTRALKVAMAHSTKPQTL